MGLFQKTPLQIEQKRLSKQEERFLAKSKRPTEPYIYQRLEEKVPEKLQNTLESAFIKAFSLIFEKGVPVIEKTYRRGDLEKTYQIHQYAAKIKQDRKTLRVFTRQAGKSGTKNLVLSGVSGIGLGLLGVGIPDIPLFTGIMLRSIYEIALHYGFEYESENEKIFILMLIQGAFSYGENIRRIDESLNLYIETGRFSIQQEREAWIRQTAGCIARELLCSKFLQGIPVVGAVGGACDIIYMKRIVAYAELKYRRRFYYRQSQRFG
ncbi:MAG TPA: EcsC family protein [Firmicutes bacterium]|nr:EcsC family protein [Bacillota bacterium]